MSEDGWVEEKKGGGAERKEEEGAAAEPERDRARLWKDGPGAVANCCVDLRWRL
jgi:hypothetical protein